MQNNEGPYVATETAISVGFCAGMSLVFAYLGFHGRSVVLPLGPGGLVYDAIPQNFALVFFAVFVPTLLTRRRGRAGRFGAVASQQRLGWQHYALVRALVPAVLFTVVAVALSYVLMLRLIPGGIDFTTTMIFKGVYGGIIGLLTTPLAVRAAIREFSGAQQRPVAIAQEIS